MAISLSFHHHDKFSLLQLDKEYGGYEEILPSSRFKIDNSKILGDLKFENLIDDQLFTRKLITSSYIDLHEIMVKLDEIIDKEYQN